MVDSKYGLSPKEAQTFGYRHSHPQATNKPRPTSDRNHRNPSSKDPCGSAKASNGKNSLDARRPPSPVPPLRIRHVGQLDYEPIHPQLFHLSPREIKRIHRMNSLDQESFFGCFRIGSSGTGKCIRTLFQTADRTMGLNPKSFSNSSVSKSLLPKPWIRNLDSLSSSTWNQKIRLQALLMNRGSIRRKYIAVVNRKPDWSLNGKIVWTDPFPKLFLQLSPCPGAPTKHLQQSPKHLHFLHSKVPRLQDPEILHYGRTWIHGCPCSLDREWLQSPYQWEQRFPKLRPPRKANRPNSFRSKIILFIPSSSFLSIASRTSAPVVPVNWAKCK